MAPTLYSIPASPPCRSVFLTAKALKLELNIKEVDLMKNKEHLQDWFLKMNPNHTIPTLEDNGFCLWESRAIMGYLVDAYGKTDTLYPKDAKGRALVNQMLDFDLAAIYEIVITMLRNIIFGIQLPDEKQIEKLNEKLTVLDEILKKTPFAAGDNLTIADLSLLVSVTTLEAVEVEYSNYENIVNWISKIQQEIPDYEEAQQGHKQLIEFLKKCRSKLTA